MKELFNDLTIENFPDLVNFYLEDGTLWQEAASEQWAELSSKYDFSEPTDEPTEEDVINALESEDYLLTTKLAIHCNEIKPLEFTVEHDSPELLYSLLSYFSIHGYYEDNKKWDIWVQVNSSALLAKAVKYNAKQCFILLLTYTDEIEAIQEDDDADTVYRSLDWLLQPQYKNIAQWHQVDKEQTTTNSYYAGELVNMDLFAAFALERKFDLAEHLIHMGWKTINPYISDFDDQLLDAAIYQAKENRPDLLEWYLSLVGTHCRYTQEVIECIDENEVELKKLVSDFSQRIDMDALEESVCEKISNNYPPYIQLECLNGLSALHHYPVRNGEIQPKPQNISVFHDIKRIYNHLLKSHVTDLKICLISNKLLSITLFEYGENKPKSRAVIECFGLEAFRRILNTCESEGTYPTDFQIQLAFLSMTEEELVQHVFSCLEPIKSFNEHAEHLTIR